MLAFLPRPPFYIWGQIEDRSHYNPYGPPFGVLEDAAEFAEKLRQEEDGDGDRIKEIQIRDQNDRVWFRNGSYIPLTKEEIVLDTIEYYRTHPRSVTSNDYKELVCRYRGPNGARCAFSRCCTEDSVFVEDKIAELQVGASLKPIYGIKDVHFWKQLQSLHDDKDNWTLNAQGGQDLTPVGKSRAVQAAGCCLPGLDS